MNDRFVPPEGRFEIKTETDSPKRRSTQKPGQMSMMSMAMRVLGFPMSLMILAAIIGVWLYFLDGLIYTRLSRPITYGVERGITPLVRELGEVERTVLIEENFGYVVNDEVRNALVAASQRGVEISYFVPKWSSLDPAVRGVLKELSESRIISLAEFGKEKEIKTLITFIDGFRARKEGGPDNVSIRADNRPRIINHYNDYFFQAKPVQFSSSL